ISQLLDAIKSGAIFALGEIHGVKENPNIIYTLIKKFSFKRLALEWEKSLENGIEIFVKGGEIDYESIMKSSDGRITAGHFALLRKLKEENLTDFFLFDDSFHWEDRDQGMAKIIIEKTKDPNLPTIVVAGSAHTNMREIREYDGKIHTSMVKELQNRGTKFVIGEIEYLSGKFFNNKIKNLGDEDVEGKSAKFYKNDEGLYVYELPLGTPADVPNINQEDYDEEYV
ncbi:MAG TPA: hypothetical protein PKD85_23760, partial [Saprospiraceae bacterium]|nr:hypothetical protein [Saprospiraceae bacterium]